MEVLAVHLAGEMPWHVEIAFDEGPVDHEPCLVVRDPAFAPALDLFPERREVALDAVHADRKGVEEREALRVFREHRREVALEREVVADGDAVSRNACEPKAL